MRFVALLGLCLLGCGKVIGAAMVLPPDAPPPEGPEPVVQLPATLDCMAPPPAVADVPPLQTAPIPPVAGQMSDAAVQAKRLFESERFGEAEPLLEAVAAGNSRDDDGNRQLAAYHRAIALFRLARFDASAAAFREIATQPGHLKFRETLLWLAKLQTAAPSAFRLADLDAYDATSLQPFRNPQQGALYAQLSYLRGRRYYEQGRRAEAMPLFQQIGPASAYRDAAARCLARLR